jgi:glycosyltransferase involved in cell wall biosynthesis
MMAMEHPLRFCMITNYYPPYNFGGDGVYVHRLSNELARRGHQVHVIHCKDAYHAFEPEEPSEPYDDHPNVTVHGLRSGWGILSPLLTQQTGQPLLKTAKIQRVLQQGFDVIHFHNFSLVGGPGVLQYGQGIKLCSAHDHWLICQTRVLFRFERAACTKRTCFLCNLWHKKPPQWWRYTGLLRSALSNIDALVVGSHFTIEQMRQLGPDVPLVHLPYFAPRPQPPSDDAATVETPDEPYFLFVGRLVKLKGLQTLIPTFRRWGKAPLLVAGTGRYERQLRQLANGNPAIRFLGHLSGARLQQLYRGAVAVIIPSITYEVGTLVMFEALSHGTPIIVRNLGGLPEHVWQSGGGYIYDSNEQLIATMEQLLANPSLRREMGRRGRQAYLQKWTPEAHLDSYLALIEDLAAGTRPQRASVHHA